MVEDYVVHAPESLHNDPYLARYSGIPDGSCGNCDGLGEDKGGLDGFLAFAKMTTPPDPPIGKSSHLPGRDAYAFKAVSTVPVKAPRVGNFLGCVGLSARTMHPHGACVQTSKRHRIGRRRRS